MSLSLSRVVAFFLVFIAVVVTIAIAIAHDIDADAVSAVVVVYLDFVLFDLSTILSAYEVCVD